jgi:hypothetical protein
MRLVSKPGEYGLGFGKEPPTSWKKIDNTIVYAFSEPANWYVEDVDWVVGLQNDRAVMIDFLEAHSWAGFDPQHDDHGYDEIHESYTNSIVAFVRQLLGKCIPPKFDLYDIRPFLNDQAGRITTIDYLYQKKACVPHSIKVTTETDETIVLRLY